VINAGEVKSVSFQFTTKEQPIPISAGTDGGLAIYGCMRFTIAAPSSSLGIVERNVFYVTGKHIDQLDEVSLGPFDGGNVVVLKDRSDFFGLSDLLHRIAQHQPDHQ
jgi:hypothetical protein